MLFVIKQANQDSSASPAAGMAQGGDAGLRLVLQEEESLQESEEDRLHFRSLWWSGTWPSFVQAPAGPFALMVLPAWTAFPTPRSPSASPRAVTAQMSPVLFSSVTFRSLHSRYHCDLVYKCWTRYRKEISWRRQVRPHPNILSTE